MREKPKVIDLTRKIGTVETLTEARINCSLEEKVAQRQAQRVRGRVAQDGPQGGNEGGKVAQGGFNRGKVQQERAREGR